MNFLKKNILKVLAPSLVLTPIVATVSCSKDDDYSVSSNVDLYSTIWNLSLEDDIKNSIFDMNIKELEEKINSNLKKDSKNNLIMKIYSFYLLWQAIKNPLSSNGSVITNQSTNIENFSTFLTNKLDPDNEDVEDDKKTYKNFKNYINTFDYKISIININSKTNTIDYEQSLRTIFANNQYILNFKIDFFTSDKETNEKIVDDSNKSILTKTALTREQRQTLNKIQNEELKQLTLNQYNYQSTKLYFDVNNKKFSTIILPSNIYPNLLNFTPDSGFSSKDEKRQLFQFEWYSSSENSTKFNSYIELLLSSSNNFSTSLNSDWTRFLKQEKLLESSNNLSNIKINLNKTIEYSKSE